MNSSTGVMVCSTIILRPPASFELGMVTTLTVWPVFVGNTDVCTVTLPYRTPHCRKQQELKALSYYSFGSPPLASLLTWSVLHVVVDRISFPFITISVAPCLSKSSCTDDTLERSWSSFGEEIFRVVGMLDYLKDTVPKLITQVETQQEVEARIPFAKLLSIGDVSTLQ